MAIRTFFDAGVFLAAHDLNNANTGRALRLFESTDRELIATNLLRLEVVPHISQATRRGRVYEICFRAVSMWIEIDDG